MWYKNLINAAILGGALFSTVAYAVDITPEVAVVLKKLRLSPSNISSTPVNGLYQLQAGTKIYYLSNDGKYLLDGSMINMETKENLTEARMKGARLSLLDGIGADKMISFKAKDEKHAITVFTDIDCGYCRKLHAEMSQYNELGISVNYLFFPRTGLGTASYDSAVSVWCDKDRNAAMTRAKSGENLPKANCENPIAQHYNLGSEMNINGTPALITEQGELMPGYLPAARLKMQLDRYSAAAEKKVSQR